MMTMTEEVNELCRAALATGNALACKALTEAVLGAVADAKRAGFAIGSETFFFGVWMRIPETETFWVEPTVRDWFYSDSKT
jgi:hypothetical protein